MHWPQNQNWSKGMQRKYKNVTIQLIERTTEAKNLFMRKCGECHELSVHSNECQNKATHKTVTALLQCLVFSNWRVGVHGTTDYSNPILYRSDLPKLCNLVTSYQLWINPVIKISTLLNHDLPNRQTDLGEFILNRYMWGPFSAGIWFAPWLMIISFSISKACSNLAIDGSWQGGRHGGEDT